MGLFSAIAAYYVIHEGAHLVYALCIGVFKQMNFIGLGMQIDVYAEQMTSQQLGVFCIVGSIATTVTAYVLVGFADKIKDMSSKMSTAYTTCRTAEITKAVSLTSRLPSMLLRKPALSTLRS